MIDTERLLEDNGLSYSKERKMFKVGDKVVWVGNRTTSRDIGAKGVVTRSYLDEKGDEMCFVHFITGEDAGKVVDSILAKYPVSCDDYMKINDSPTTNNTFASMADDFLNACGVLTTSNTTNEDDVLKQIQNYNRVVKVVEIPEKNTSPKNKYDREIVPGVWIDVYDLLAAWKVTNPALQHLIKKALQAGDRGHKDLETDLQDIIDSALRAKQLEGF